MGTLPTDRTWKVYGEKAPYFGVFGQEEFLNENLNEESLEYYFSSGVSYIDELFSVILSKIDPGFKPETILDFGCGPGRMLIPLSRYAREVIAMDISGNMLEEAQKNCAERNISNVSFLLSDDELSLIRDKKFDMVHSFIVLQHMSIRRGEKLFRRLTNKINPGGIGVVHLTYHDSYPNRLFINYFRFRIPFLSTLVRLVRCVIKKKPFKNFPQMQMNNFNLNRIFTFLQKAGIQDVYTTFSDHHDYWGVVLFFKKN